MVWSATDMLLNYFSIELVEVIGWLNPNLRGNYAKNDRSFPNGSGEWTLSVATICIEAHHLSHVIPTSSASTCRGQLPANVPLEVPSPRVPRLP